MRSPAIVPKTLSNILLKTNKQTNNNKNKCPLNRMMDTNIKEYQIHYHFQYLWASTVSKGKKVHL
jgi:hypothetical protein